MNNIKWCKSHRTDETKATFSWQKLKQMLLNKSMHMFEQKNKAWNRHHCQYLNMQPMYLPYHKKYSEQCERCCALSDSCAVEWLTVFWTNVSLLVTFDLPDVRHRLVKQKELVKRLLFLSSKKSALFVQPFSANLLFYLHSLFNY